ncbi:hypothetical protein LARI1_G000914 [Lachnellula arida]|uniref:Uncharacterized protein n=1 Tax=Lachnellula arida TaxID=1316785 RepID=A0A8T9BN89_9HELO|nr:hypothetical protein LARI1_G000914 [Lachnellula arida]
MPRSASNLLTRMLSIGVVSDDASENQQPNVIPRFGGGYFFMPANLKASEMHLHNKHIDDWTSEDKAIMQEIYQECFVDFQKHIKQSETEGKIVLVKEHASFLVDNTVLSKFVFPERELEETAWTVGGSGVETRSPNNLTVLPDGFLESFFPIILIRHPALAFPSSLRVISDLKGEKSKMGQRAIMTWKWSRALYEFYWEHFSKADLPAQDVTWPIVIDADDIINHPQTVVRLYEITGLDKTKLRFEWEAATEQEMTDKERHIKVMGSSILASTGVMKDKVADNLDIDVEAEKWRAEFGDDEGVELEKLVRQAMPDYEFLKSKRMIV